MKTMTDTTKDAVAGPADGTPASGTASDVGPASDARPVGDAGSVGDAGLSGDAGPTGDVGLVGDPGRTGEVGTPSAGSGAPGGGSGRAARAAPGTPAGGAPGAPGVGGLPTALGTAERAMTRLLLDVLAETRTPELTWYAFQRLSVLQPAPTPDAFRRDLGNELELDDASAASLLDEIMAAGLMHEVSDRDDGEMRMALTAGGESVRARIRRSVAGLVVELVESFDPKDIEVTTRMLTGLTERARALHRRAAPDPSRAES
jgi:DNA-binding MarR family transcriptional regulator